MHLQRVQKSSLSPIDEKRFSGNNIEGIPWKRILTNKWL